MSSRMVRQSAVVRAEGVAVQVLEHALAAREWPVAIPKPLQTGPHQARIRKMHSDSGGA